MFNFKYNIGIKFGYFKKICIGIIITFGLDGENINFNLIYV